MMHMAGVFCMGPGSLMGASGFKWAGRDPMADCSTLWLENWGLTTFTRSILGCVLVFLVAALSQYLTTSNDCQLEQSKSFAKHRLESSVSRQRSGFYDPELGSTRVCDKGKTCSHTQAEDSTVHPERPEAMATLEATTVYDRRHPTVAAVMMTLAAEPVSVKVDNWTHLGDALMRGLRVFLAYLLMLVVMTYDLTLISSIVGGFMASFFVFGKDTAKVPVSADPCCS